MTDSLASPESCPTCGQSLPSAFGHPGRPIGSVKPDTKPENVRRRAYFREHKRKAMSWHYCEACGVNHTASFSRCALLV